MRRFKEIFFITCYCVNSSLQRRNEWFTSKFFRVRAFTWLLFRSFRNKKKEPRLQDETFPDLWSQQSFRLRMCVCVCVCAKYAEYFTDMPYIYSPVTNDNKSGYAPTRCIIFSTCSFNLPYYACIKIGEGMESTASVNVFYSLYHILLVFHPFCSQRYLGRNTPSIILLHFSMNFNASLTLCKWKAFRNMTNYMNIIWCIRLMYSVVAFR
jgi:hypothetical protein